MRSVISFILMFGTGTVVDAILPPGAEADRWVLIVGILLVSLALGVYMSL